MILKHSEIKDKLSTIEKIYYNQQKEIYVDASSVFAVLSIWLTSFSLFFIALVPFAIRLSMFNYSFTLTKLGIISFGLSLAFLALYFLIVAIIDIKFRKDAIKYFNIEVKVCKNNKSKK